MIDVGLGADGAPVLLRLDSTFAPHDTMPIPRADESSSIDFISDGQRVMSAQIPFAPAPRWALHSVRGIVVGQGGDYRLHHIDFDGDTIATIEVARTRIPVTAAEQDSALAAFRKMEEMAGGKPERQPRIPDEKPAHGMLFVDDVNYIWVQRTSPEGEAPSFDVIDDRGRLLGSVTFPGQVGYLTPAVRNGRMAIATTVDDVPTVIVYDIVRPQTGM
jgi:hypothetical protein